MHSALQRHFSWLASARQHAQTHRLAFGSLSVLVAAGSMLFVVSHEVIPQTHRNGHETPATLGLMLGFALMMVLDTTLG